MGPVTVETTIARSREDVFDYLVDVANMPEFTDHFLTRWHLTRENSVGVGAGARFWIKLPLNRFSWSDLTVVEGERTHRIVARGRGGKWNRIRSLMIITLTPATKGSTRVDWSWETFPEKLPDRIMEKVAGRGWWKRRMNRGNRRLRAILEENRDRGQRATVAGG
jgi:uncharacterized protein YndB with AHSA1/START domain